MFSAIPMPQTEWTNKSMRYAVVRVPADRRSDRRAGVPVAFCVPADGDYRNGYWRRESVYFPVLVTGGIHLDGFCDTADALASHQDTEKKSYRF